jgi:hypothetical protein
MMNTFAKMRGAFRLLMVFSLLLPTMVRASWLENDPARELLIRDYTTELLRASGMTDSVTITYDSALGSPEAFGVSEKAHGRFEVTAGGPAGALYGVQEILLPQSVVESEGAPDFEVRGAVLMMLSASWGYQSELSPERYPWFYDRELMTRYLDYLTSARLNTLIIWSGHLFPHILELPEYPHASRFSAEEIKRNQEQFRWLTTECAKRNITVLTHFYNIHISADLAEAMGRTGDEPTRYEEPDEFVTKYYQTLLTRYFETFPGVGLYICPGESLGLEYQESWFRDVVFDVAEKTGRQPPLVIRDWTLDPEFQEKLPEMYPNLYSELKHNDETITSPWPDERHEQWAGVLQGHIVNLHDPADAAPYHVGSPRLLGEMVRHWRDAGYFSGSWWYPPQSWIWPNTLDRVAEGDDASAAWTKVAFERDPLWHLLEGRLLWDSDRPVDTDVAWAAEWLAHDWGASPEAAADLVGWYDLTAPILPGLQNLTAIRFGNFFPPSIARVHADVDAILEARKSLDEGPIAGATGLTGQRYYSRPIDAFTLSRYVAKMKEGDLRDLRSLPVARYAELLEENTPTDGWVRPDVLLQIYREMAEQSLSLAVVGAAKSSADEAMASRWFRMEVDSRCLLRTIDYYEHKILAALAKRRYELSENPRFLQDFEAHMRASVPAYEALIRYALTYYEAGSSMWDAKPWERTLEDTVKVDFEKQMEWLESVRDVLPDERTAP